MRVGVLAHSFPRFQGDTHGPFVKHLSEAVARRGHSVDALIPWDPEIRPDPDTAIEISTFRYIWPPSFHQLGYSRTLRRDIRLAAGAYLQSPFYFAFGERALERLSRRARLQLVHAHWLLPNGFIAARASAATGVPFAVTLHGSDIFMAERNPLFRRMAKFTLAQAAHVTSCSPDLKDRLITLGGVEHRDKVHLVANGTEVVDEGPPALELRAKLGLPIEGPLLVAVGRLVDKKGFRFLLDALPALLARQPDVHLALGGGGPLLEPLERQASDLGVSEHITFLGPLSHPDVLNLIAAGDVFVMPSVRDPRGNIDGLPIVVLEAMAAGRAVVATEIAGLPLAVEPGVTGVLVPEKDPDALSVAIADLLGTPGRSAEFGVRGRERVRTDLNWDAIAAIHEGLYLKAIGS
ncbi:MAG: glycosyltransferase [Thermoanaerobaculia bacterium]|nr:glycosyltransferase [Thermoanaerobaculia bacterium]